MMKQMTILYLELLMSNINNNFKNNIKNFTNDGWEFLLHSEQHKDIAIDSLAKILNTEQSVEFTFNNLYYEILESSESGYIINVYTNDERDEYNKYLEQNLIDGGLCTGTSKNAIEFMLC